jgi:ABC-type transport system substrate-binding protein
MLKKTILAILAVFIMTMLLIPVNAWVYSGVNPKGLGDGTYETYGPHADQLLIHFYATDVAEFTVMKGAGPGHPGLDITDWPLSKTTLALVNETGVDLVDYGAEFGIRALDMNENNATWLGNPLPLGPPNEADTTGSGQLPGTTALNPLLAAGGPGTDWTADVWLRRAIDYLIDRTAICADPSIAPFGIPLYTGIAPSLVKYSLGVYGNGTFPWAWEYSPTLANATLDAHGYPIDPATGVRMHDGKDVKLIVYVRSDDIGRTWVGDWLKAQFKLVHLDTSGFIYASSDVCYDQVMNKENFNLYTCGWSLSPDPDLSLWWYYFYWWPGDTCYNYDAINDPGLNAAEYNLYTANTQADAVFYAKLGQYYEVYNAHAPMVYAMHGIMASAQWNVGGHGGDTTENQDWLGVTGDPGYGQNNGYSFLDMHTNKTACGGGMTIDYGFKASPIKLNPIYSSSLWDWNFMGLCYDSLLTRNATDKTWQNWMTTSYSVGLYDNPNLGTCTAITISLKPGLMWSDGQPLTLADVRFSVDPVWSEGLTQMLLAAGYPAPYWYGSIQGILSFRQIDPQTFQVLEDVKSYWGLSWVGEAMILPEHIWKPMIQADIDAYKAGKNYPVDLEGRMPDPNLVGNGPWKFVKWDQVAEVGELVPNPYYMRYNCPVDVTMQTNANWYSKFIPLAGLNPVVVKLTNLNIRGPTTVTNFTLWVTYPNTTRRTVIYWTGSIAAEGVQAFNIPWNWTYGLYKATYELESTTSDGQTYNQTVLLCPVYCTIPEDIAGSTYYDDIGWPTYPYKSEVPTPDISVDMSDLNRAVNAFCSAPGDARWDPVADIFGCYFIDEGDLGDIEHCLGWSGSAIAIAVISVMPSKTVVGQGYDCNISVTVANGGSYTETFNVTAYANATSIASQNITLSIGHFTTITFTWNASGFAKGNYTLNAYAWPVPGETNTANNRLNATLTVMVTMTGDVQPPWGFVDMSDISYIAAGYGKSSTDSPQPPGWGYKWQPNADITNDNFIDMSDIAIAARQYGQTDP